MSSCASLDGPRAKLDRAEHHLHDLQRAVEACGALDPFRITEPELIEDGSMFVCRGHTVIAAPDEIGLTLGDYLVNLRAALDHLAWQLVLLAKAEPPAKLTFPICDSEENFERVAGALAPLPPKQLDTIRQVQPFNHPSGDPRQHLLEVLRELSNADKHRLVHPLSSSAVDADPDTAGFRLTKGASKLVRPQIRSRWAIADGEPILRVSLDPPDPDAEAEWFGQFDVRLVFGDDRVTHEAINKLHPLVRGIVELFAGDFAAR